MDIGWGSALEFEVAGCEDPNDDPKEVVVVVADFLTEDGAVGLQPGAFEVVARLIFVFARLVTPPDVKRAVAFASDAVGCVTGDATTATQIAANEVVATAGGHGWQHGMGKVGHE